MKKTGRALAILFFLLCGFGSPLMAFQQGDSAMAYPREHYEFLEKELQEYRQFLQQERMEHRGFLEDHYNKIRDVGAIALLFFTGILGFFGWKTWRDISAQRALLGNEARERLAAELEKARNELLSETNRQIEASKSRFEREMREIFSSNLENYDEKYKAALKLIGHQLAVEKGRYLLVGTAEKLEQMQEEGAEIQLFSRALSPPEFFIASAGKKPRLDKTDVVIYRSNADADGEDAYLKDDLLPHLSGQGEKLPLVVYAKGLGEFLKNETLAALNRYLLFQMANNPGTLIDNTASSFRSFKLINKNKPQA